MHVQDPPERPKGHNQMDMSENFQLWTMSGESCPEGTIPIRRTTEQDMLRASSVSRFGRKIRRRVRRDTNSNGHEVCTETLFSFLLFSFSSSFFNPKEDINKQLYQKLLKQAHGSEVLCFSSNVFFFFFSPMCIWLLYYEAKNSHESINNKFRLAGFLFLSYHCETSTFSYLWQSQNFMVPQLVMFHLLQSKVVFHSCVCCTYLHLV